MKIRRIRETDNRSLAKMIREVFEEHEAPRSGTVYSDPTTDDLYRLFRHPRSVLWVAELKGIPVGCSGVYPTDGLEEGCAELVKLYLSHHARGKGIGRKLLDSCIESARGLGYTSLYLESLPHFSRALGMYERAGFKNLEGPLGDSQHTTCNIWMIKEL